MMSLYVFQGQNAITISNVLYFWYQNMFLFQLETRILLIEILVKFFFFKFFLHWSINVRETFIYIFVYSMNCLVREVHRNQGPIQNMVQRIVFGINQMRQYGETYQKEFMKWTQKSRQFQRKHPLSSIQKTVLSTLANEEVKEYINAEEVYGIKSLKSQKLPSLLDDDFVVSEQIFELDKGNSSLKAGQQMQKYRQIFAEKVEKSSINEGNMSYCLKSIQKFETILSKFKQNARHIMETKEFPKMVFNIPIDHFEMNESEADFDW